MDKQYKIVEEFDCCDKRMVTVMIGNNAHVMEYDDWKKIFVRNYQNRRKNIKVNWSNFDSIKGYKIS